MALTLPTRALDFDLIQKQIAKDGNCTHPAGHCYAANGGSGGPVNLRVPEGRGGGVEIWQLDQSKSSIIKKYGAYRCQYCRKYEIVEI